MANKMSMFEIVMMVAVVVIAVSALGEKGVTPSGTSTGSAGVATADICKIVTPSATLTGQRMFLSGTALTTEWARAVRINGDSTKKDIGSISLNSGNLPTVGNGKYQIYFGINATTASSLYYPTIMSYTAPCLEAPDEIAGVVCRNSTPTITVFNENGDVMSTTTHNEQQVDADDARTVTVRVRAGTDACYGMPGASKDNALCFRYNTSDFKAVTAETGVQDMPYEVTSTYGLTGFNIACYKLGKVADNAQVDVKVKLESTSTNPTNASGGANGNVSIYTDDISFDLNADTLEDIIGFQDEDNNILGTTVQTGMIYIN